MKSFKQYINFRESGADISIGNSDSDLDFIGNKGVSLRPVEEIAKLAWRRYKPDMQRLIDELAAKDEDIKELAKQLDDFDPSAEDGPVRQPQNKDEIVPHSSDGHGGGGEDGGDGEF